jgi:serine protease Do
MHGDVVGMNTAIATQIGQSAGVGFAIPANLIRSELPRLVRGETISRGLLGVMIQDVTPDLARQFHLSGDNGTLVAQVNQDSPAQRAGIAVGDVIVRYDGRDIRDTRELRNDVAATAPGKRVRLVVIRDAQERTFDVVVGTQSSGPVAQAAGPGGGGDLLDKLGLELAPLTPDLARQYGVGDVQGVIISGIRAGTVASMSGLQPGDVIVEVDRKPVASVAALQRVLASAADRNSILLRVNRQGGSLFVVLNAPVS